ncbi:MAG: serine/threonine protein kinase [Sandaracinaceae bacterium]
MIPPPALVGRYQVVGHLASGGMADIFLAKLTGPSGFERPAVIKRILPSLADRENVLQMFLDEARLAARIQHANVVHVQELVEQDGGFYLVMEYLEGESALSVMKRAARRRERFPAVLAAHIIAEACAGIHAAHELTSDNGEPLGLVHRDISPGNVFVTYAGEVKVLDFGIAKFKAKTTETMVGKVRGKFAYMSPEQCRAQPVDRRSDVFSLGTLLFELSTGRRLFARETHRLTMKAVVRAEVPPLKRIDPSYPDALIGVLRKALAIEPGERYQTAARMRRDLVAFVQRTGAEELPEERLAMVMKSWFPQRIDEKRKLLGEVRSGTRVTRIPEAEVDTAVELPDADTLVSGSAPLHQQSTVETPSFAPTDLDAVPPLHFGTPPHEQPSISQVSAPSVTPSEPPLGEPSPFLSRAAVMWLAAAAICLLGLGVSFGVIVSAMEQPSTSVSMQDLDVEAAPDATRDRDRPVATRSVPVPTPPRPDNVTFDVRVTPDGSRITFDGEPRGLTPSRLEVPHGVRPIRVEVSHDGYRAMVTEFVPDQPRTIGGALAREEPAPRIRRGRGRSTSRSGGSRGRETATEQTTDDPFRRYGQ